MTDDCSVRRKRVATIDTQSKTARRPCQALFFQRGLRAASPFLTQEELARLLRVRPATVKDWRQKRGRKSIGVGPPFIRLGRAPYGRVRYDVRAVLAWLEAGRGGHKEGQGEKGGNR